MSADMYWVFMSVVKIGVTTVTLCLEAQTNFYLYRPLLLSDTAEILCKKSARGAVEYLWPSWIMVKERPNFSNASEWNGTSVP
jgi:hypothetical protein